MDNIRTPEEVIEYINGHIFATRYHALCIRALIMSKYEGVKELTKIEFKYPLKESIDMGLPILTANDVIKYLTEK